MKKITVLFLLILFSGFIFSSEIAGDLKEESHHSSFPGYAASTVLTSPAIQACDSDNVMHADKTIPVKALPEKREIKKHKKDFLTFIKTKIADVRFSGLAIAGFILGLVGLIIFGIPFGIAAFAMGLISFLMIMNSGGQLKGKGFAIAAFILGIIDIIGAIIVISATL